MTSEDATKVKPSSNPEAWVDQYGDMLYRYALGMVKDPATAEELVQETFLGALRSIKSFKKQASERTWLIAILKHKIIDHFRAKAKKQSISPLESLPELPDAYFDGNGHWKTKPAKWAVDPTKLYQQKEFFEVLYKCLAQLPARQSEAFILREIKGLDTDEICKALDITATNTWVILYRARMVLRRCLEANWFDREV